jgi:hypothetical protein
VALIDDVLPRFDANELHSLALALDPARAIALALAAPITGDPVIAALFRLRGINARGSIGGALTRLGLEELRSAEGDVVFGASGTPWRPGGGIHPFDEGGPGRIQIATDFRADGERLSTETRILAGDAAARRSFLRYWRLVGPFSALIRRRWLAQIAKSAA